MRRQSWDEGHCSAASAACARPETLELLSAGAAGRWDRVHVLGSPPCVRPDLSPGLAAAPGMPGLASVSLSIGQM